MRVFAAAAAASLVLSMAVASAQAQAQRRQTPAPVSAELQREIDALANEVAELSKQSVQVPTLAAAAQELAARVEALEQAIELLRRERGSFPDAVSALDRLSLELEAVASEVATLRTVVAGLEQPWAPSSGGGVRRDNGFAWETDDGLFKLRLSGFGQVRYELSAVGGELAEAGFVLRRARLEVSGHVGGERLRYALSLEPQRDRSLLDAYADYRIRPWLAVRAGQSKVQFTRMFITSDKKHVFAERPRSVEAYRYDRDVGVGVHGEVLGERLRYFAGVSNGAGPNRRNDNLDLVQVLRVEGAVLGRRIGYDYADVDADSPARITVGAGVTHDLSRVPAEVSGIPLERDVDGDGTVDNVRVVQASADVIARYRGFEAAVEGYWRQERWGTILEHPGNAALAEAVGDQATRNHLGLYGMASYMAIPRRLLVGGRVGHARMPFFGVADRPDTLPRADRLLELDLLVQLYRLGYRSLGVTYTFFDYNAIDGPDPDDDTEHRVIVEAQLVF